MQTAFCFVEGQFDARQSSLTSSCRRVREFFDKQLHYVYQLLAFEFAIGGKSCQRKQSGACSGYAERSRNRCVANIINANACRRKRRFFCKHHALVMNILEFYTDSLGQKFCRAVSKIPDIMHRAVVEMI